jgi:hypothetical protein
VGNAGEVLPPVTPTPAPEVQEVFNPATAVVVASRVHVAPGEVRTIPFVVAWHMPRLVGAANLGPELRPAYAQRFASLTELLAWAGPRLVRIKAAAQQWQALVLNGTLPLDARALKLQNAATLISHGVHMAGGRFSMLEVPGRGRGMIGGLEFREPSQQMLLGLYPELDREELLGFAAAQKPSGLIPRHVGNLHGGFRDLETEFVGEGSGDATAAFVMQAAGYYRATGDEDFRRQIWPAVERALNWLATTRETTGQAGLQDAVDPTGRSFARRVNGAAARLAGRDFMAGSGSPELPLDRTTVPGGGETSLTDVTTTATPSMAANATTAGLATLVRIDSVSTASGNGPTGGSDRATTETQPKATSAPTPTPIPTPVPTPAPTDTELLTSQLSAGSFPGATQSAWVLEAFAQARRAGLPPSVDQQTVQEALTNLEPWRGTPGEFWLRPLPPSKAGERLSAAVAFGALGSVALRAGQSALGWEISRMAQASATGRTTGLWAFPLFEDRGSTVAASASTAAQSYFQGHRAGSVGWTLGADVAGFAMDVPRGILYLDPPRDRTGAPPIIYPPAPTPQPTPPPAPTPRLRRGQRPLVTPTPDVPAFDPVTTVAVTPAPTPPPPIILPMEVPLLTPRAWLWLEWDNKASSATLTCLRIPPGRFGGEPISIQTIATGRESDGSLLGSLALPEPMPLVPGATWVLQREGDRWVQMSRVR